MLLMKKPTEKFTHVVTTVHQISLSNDNTNPMSPQEHISAKILDHLY